MVYRFYGRARREWRQVLRECMAAQRGCLREVAGLELLDKAESGSPVRRSLLSGERGAYRQRRCDVSLDLVSFAKLRAQPFDRPRSQIWDASERFVCCFSEIADSFQSGEFYCVSDSSGQAHHLD